LRMRHLPFKIGIAERDAWVYHMKNAVELEISNPTAKEFLIGYFERTATFMINKTD
jgi:hemoglobin